MKTKKSKENTITATAQATPRTPQEALAELQKQLEGTANAIALYARNLTVEEGSAIQDLESRMEFRLSELVAESKVKEADIKLATMRQVLEIIKKPQGFATK